MRNATYSRGANDVVNNERKLKQVGWWLLLAICGLFSAYSVYLAAIEIAFQFGIILDAPHRGAPIIFIFHAFSGAVALLVGALQLNRHLLISNRTAHRIFGWIYVAMIWLSSTGALWLAVTFDVSLISKIIFSILAALWFCSTTLAFLYAKRRQFKQHREWMLRSFALSLFFITFSFWVDGFSSFLPERVGYPLAVFTSWSFNILVAEIWIRRTQSNWKIPVRRLFVEEA